MGDRRCVFSRPRKLREPICDFKYHRLAKRVAKPEEKLLAVLEGNGQLEEEKARL